MIMAGLNLPIVTFLFLCLDSLLPSLCFFQWLLSLSLQNGWHVVAQIEEIPTVACTRFKILGSDFLLLPT